MCNLCLAAQSLYLHQLILWQILEFSGVPSPTPLSPSAAEAAEQGASLQPRSPGVSLKAQVSFGYHITCGSASSVTGWNKGSRMWSHNLRALVPC